MNAHALVSKLIESDLDPKDHIMRLNRLPAEVAAEVAEIRDLLQESANRLRALTPDSGIDERDDAVEHLSRCAQRIYYLNDNLEFEWVMAALELVKTILDDLLNQDSFAQAGDAVPVQQAVDVLTDLLK